MVSFAPQQGIATVAAGGGFTSWHTSLHAPARVPPLFKRKTRGGMEAEAGARARKAPVYRGLEDNGRCGATDEPN